MSLMEGSDSERMTGKPHLTAVAPTGVAIRPRCAGFGNRDRFELNGKIGLHRRQDNSASGMLQVAAMVANIDFPICS